MVPPPEATQHQQKSDNSPHSGTTPLPNSTKTLNLIFNDSIGSKACLLTLTILLCGYYVMMNDWQQQMWFLFAGSIALILAPWPHVWPHILRDRFLRCAAHFLAWMTLTSFLAPDTLNQDSSSAAHWLYGTSLLIAFALLCWHSARNLATLQHVGWWVGMTAALAALVSMVMFYLTLPDHIFGERLRNWFVYGGLNPVATGLTLGFASMWLTCARNTMPQRSKRLLASIAIIILLLAVFFTRSRGAVLALIAGYITLICIYGLRTNRTPITIFLSIAILFQISGPLVTMVSTMQATARTFSQTPTTPQLSPTTPTNTTTTTLNPDGLPPNAYRNPALELIHRGDNGRFPLYKSAINSLQTPRQWLMGIGQWSTEHLWKPNIHWNPEHMHSIFLATLVHGGIIGLLLLTLVYTLGIWRSLQLAKTGHGTWLVLLAFGSTGLLFDGQTLTTFTSIPRMEVLLVTFPLIISAAGYHHLLISKNHSTPLLKK